MTLAWIGLGSNLADPQAQVRSGIEALAHLPGSAIRAQSSLYRSKPLGNLAQPDYINAVVSIETALPPFELLHALQTIERDHGRDRSGSRWSPRTLDLDLLLYGDSQILSDELTIPHPGIPQRNFVLCPLLEIDSKMRIPGWGPAREILERIGMQGIEKLKRPDS
ncbi:MAG: 2-amino-4-hydroxy-6-hydroxymethyldihydropteridine diphosphokinase [Gammaproteobacteria bacterium]|nr:MAG: 2-amino-4-hydroxy-6-hydroxymethyldihydropteridine diphosphokinase [Gammaproteobacteria bacterium]